MEKLEIPAKIAFSPAPDPARREFASRNPRKNQASPPIAASGENERGRRPVIVHSP